MPPIVGIFGEAATNGAIESGGSERNGVGDGSGFFFEDGGSDAELTPAVEGAMAGEHFVEHGAEREDVAAAVEFLAFNLFGRHVLKSADDGAFLGDGILLGRGSGERGESGLGSAGLGEAEVEKFCAGLGEHDVGRFDIAMNDAAAVGFVEGVGEFGADFYDLR